MSLEALSKKVRVLEDIEEIKKLKARYCLYCDANFDADALVSLFAEGAVWEGEGLGRFEGRDAIHNFYKNITQRLTFAVHYVANPIIEVSGNNARGTWYLWEPATLQGKQAIWIGGRYEDEYVRVDGKWLFKKVYLKILFRAPYDKGWAKP